LRTAYDIRQVDNRVNRTARTARREPSIMTPSNGRTIRRLLARESVSKFVTDQSPRARGLIRTNTPATTLPRTQNMGDWRDQSTRNMDAWHGHLQSNLA